MSTYCLEVKGAFACFTRPEMKVERVSYDVITPSAARGVFEAILWKPAIQWHIDKIEVLKPIQWENIRRNEVKSKAKDKAEGAGIFIEDDRVQRASLLLRDVAYRIHAHFDLKDDTKHTPHFPHLRCSDGNSQNAHKKFDEMFRRRARKGQCFQQPYLGTREFAAHFKLIESEQTPVQCIEEDRDLGWMLYDLDYSNKDDIRPMFFKAIMQQGVITVPHKDSQEVIQ